MKNSDHSAFPFIETFSHESINPGLTKREYFAGLAMQGCIAMQAHPESGGHNDDPGYVVKHAIRYADELLKQLQNK